MLQSLLNDEPGLRYSAHALLRHPWLYSAQGIANPYESPRQLVMANESPNTVAAGHDQSSGVDVDSPVSAQTPGVRRDNTVVEDTAGDDANWDLIEAANNVQLPSCQPSAQAAPHDGKSLPADLYQQYFPLRRRNAPQVTGLMPDPGSESAVLFLVGSCYTN